MAFDPFYSSSPSDSGLLDGTDANYSAGNVPRRQEPSGPSTGASSEHAVPQREEYVAPEPGEVDATAPEESLRDVPLPDGFLARLRGVVNDF